MFTIFPSEVTLAALCGVSIIFTEWAEWKTVWILMVCGSSHLISAALSHSALCCGCAYFVFMTHPDSCNSVLSLTPTCTFLHLIFSFHLFLTFYSSHFYSSAVLSVFFVFDVSFCITQSLISWSYILFFFSFLCRGASSSSSLFAASLRFVFRENVRS